MTTLRTATIATPLGPFTLALRDHALCAAGFADSFDRLASRLSRRFPRATLEPGPVPVAIERAFSAYWSGDLAALDAVATDLGGTPFQASVWAALRRVPAGTTCAYATLAQAIGAPTASRAVGAANGQNPVSIVIPCHRVVGANGALTGYAWGLDRKRALLAHEGVSARAAA